MNKLHSITIASFFALMLSVTPTLVVPANAEQATGSATILGTCGISFPLGNSIDYGALLPDTYSANIPLTILATGTVLQDVYASGTDWEGQFGDTVMLVSTTHFSGNSGALDYDDKTPLITTDTLLNGGVNPAYILETIWQVHTTLVDPAFVGYTIQTVTFTSDC